ncbi:benzoate 4-monooxygenase cytochrome P450, partial [Aureobasidium melanogenum]
MVTITFALGSIAAIFFLYTVSLMVYNVYFHPLSKYPGPKMASATILWYMYSLGSGKHHEHCDALHQKYGKVVRIGPDQLSFISAQAYKEIYGHRPGKVEMTKDPRFYGVLAKENLIATNVPDHARMRKLLAHAFSDRALREQESLMSKYIDALVTGLLKYAHEGKPVDLVSWYNFATFDIIGDLAFGEPFGSLETSNLHPWVQMLFDGIKGGALMRCSRYWPSLSKVLYSLVSRKLMAKRNAHQSLSSEKVQRRLELGSERVDFTTYILRHNDEKGMTPWEIEVNASLLIIAGSETTATLLSGCTYLLLKNPQALSKLTQEVRSAFQSEQEITIASVSRLEYLLAVLEESFRLYPPAPTGLPRLVPDGGEVIDGAFVPAQTAVRISQFAASRSSQNFLDPLTFRPERWIEGSKNANDQLAVVQPFSMGPRNCLGKNLAYAELKLIVARMIWRFDLTMDESSKDWMDQCTYNLWEKHELKVRLHDRV